VFIWPRFEKGNGGGTAKVVVEGIWLAVLERIGGGVYVELPLVEGDEGKFLGKKGALDWITSLKATDSIHGMRGGRAARNGRGFLRAWS